MKRNVLSQAVLYGMLDRLGFTHRRIPGSHVLFEHSLSNTWFAFPLQMKADSVLRGQLLAMRTILIGRGLVEPDEFERLLDRCRNGAARKPAKTKNGATRARARR